MLISLDENTISSSTSNRVPSLAMTRAGSPWPTPQSRRISNGDIKKAPNLHSRQLINHIHISLKHTSSISLP